MKTKLLLRLSALCLGLVWGTSAMAKTYCQETLTNGGKSIQLTCQKLSDDQYEIKIEGVGLTGIGGSYMNVNGTGGYYLNGNHSVVSSDSTTITCSITSSSDPNFYTPLYVLMPGEVNFGTPASIEWGLCSACTLTQAPTMNAASLASKTYNSAIINVAGTDEESSSVTTFIVNGSGFTNQAFTAIAGQITLTSLTPSQDYDLQIKAKDRCGNISTESKSVSFRTDELIYHDFPTGHLGNASFGDPSGRILLTLSKTSSSSISVQVVPNNAGTVIDFVKAEINGVAYEIGVAGDGTSVGGQAIAVSGLASLNFTCNLLWHSVGTPAVALWTTNMFSVSESSLYDNTTSVSVPNMLSPRVVLYPNPAKNFVTLSSDVEISGIQVYNMLGKVVETATVNNLQATVDCSQFQVGQYILHITLADGRILTEKVVKR